MLRLRQRLNDLKWAIQLKVLPFWPVLLFVAGVLAIYFLVDRSEDKKAIESPLPDSADEVVVSKELPPLPPEEHEAAYAKALEAVEANRLDQARTLMHQLAPLDGNLGDGYAQAHVWVAKDLLSGAAKTSLPTLPSTLTQHPKLTAKAIREISQHLKQAIELDPMSEEAHQLLALYYVQIGEARSAITLLEDAVDRLPSVRLILASLYSQTDNPGGAKKWGNEAALAYRELALSQPQIPKHRLLWAQAEMVQENDDAALAIIDRGEAIHPTEPAFKKLRLAIHQRQYRRALKVSDHKEAFVQLGTMLEISPDDSEVVGQIGHLLSLPETRAQAQQMLNRLTESSAAPANTYKLLGDVEAAEERWSTAIPFYEDALQRLPDFVAAKNNLALCLSKTDPPELDRALLLIEEVIVAQRKLGQVSPNFLETRGQILVQLGDYSKAVTDLEQAISSIPETKRHSLHLALAEAYAHMGNESLSETHRRLAKEGE